ncbi:MAG: FtsX-like permease family protein, partial [Bacteroidales bacterium]|nr:FtsX-like permease family protein [Bacteroidales bacterium]
TIFRNVLRYKGYTLINVSGLAIGLAACLVIFTYLSYEFSYDKFNNDYEDIYRSAIKGRFAEDFFDAAVSMPPLVDKIKSDFPQVKSATRIDKYLKDCFLSFEDKKFYEEGFYFADSSFFDVFSVEMISGNPAKALTEPNSIVLTEHIARKYFGHEDAFGKMLRLNDQVNIQVTGVIRDIPENSHMKFSMLGSISSIDGRLGRESFTDNWGSLFLYTYVRLLPGTEADNFEEKIRFVIKDAFGEAAEEYNIEMIPYLQPVAGIHLHSNLMAELEPNSDISYIYIFSAVALFILIIASINFMNLSTARATKRSREVGMRKVSGATREQLMRQFLFESLVISFFCLIIAFVMVEALLPIFGNLTGIDLEPYFHRPMTFAVMILLGLFVGIFSGAYPSFILSAFQPIRAIKGELYQGMKKSVMRNLLVLLQFTISIVMLVSTWFIYKQMEYVKNKKLGFDKENLVIIPLKSERIKEQGSMLKNEFEQLGSVKMVSLTSSVPGEGLSGKGFSPEGVDSKSPWILYMVVCDHNFMDVFDMKIKEGRKLSRDFGTDSMAMVINEALVRKLGWEDPIGKKIYDFGQEDSIRRYFTVVGVVEDFHYQSLHDAIEPSVIMLNKADPDYLAIRLHPGDPAEGIRQLQEKWEEVETAFPFEYFFMKEEYEDQYRSEQKMAELFITFTILAIFIACLGLF